MKQNDIPVYYQEHPLEVPRNGQAVQHENTNESALAIALWLSEQGVTSWVVPRGKGPGQAALIRIDAPFLDSTVFPGDWVLVNFDKTVHVLPRQDFEAQFHDAREPWTFPFTEGKN